VGVSFKEERREVKVERGQKVQRRLKREEDESGGRREGDI